MLRKRNKNNKSGFIHTPKNNSLVCGFTLIEALVGTAIFVILALSVYQTYLVTMNVIRLSQVKVTATALANEQFEIMRNLPYSDIGIVAGLPSGKIPATQNLIRDNKEFTVKTTIRNIDDPFDGTIGDTPNDTSPADYKLAELEITCATCRNFGTLNLTTNIAPKALESASTNGAIFVKVFDAVGQPVPEANIHIENNLANPPFIIDDVTNNDGILQIVDAPPGAEAYEIIVSKPGYSSDQTYATGDEANPNPEKTHATVLVQQLTQISFIIDKTSTVEVQSVNNLCEAVPNIDFSLSGQKLIGTEPDVYKYAGAFSTDASGLETVSDLEWDTYNLSFTDIDYDLAGVIPSGSFDLGTDSTLSLKLIVATSTPKSLLITVNDAVTGLPLSDVDVGLTGTDYDTALTTGRGFLRQTDWSAGAGQENFTDQAKYFDSDGQAEINDPAGAINLKKVLNEYESSAWLISSTFDTGSASNFHQILWQPQSQPPESGTDSVRIQIATNNDQGIWSFKGPDGTVGTYYTLAEQNLHPVHDGDRYLRYKVYLQTANIATTPTISDISFTFTSDCVPPGQAFFTGLLNNSYSLRVSRAGYETFTNTISTNSNWQQIEITLTPQ